MPNLVKPQAIIFDWDNTLVDTWPKLMKSLNGTLEKFGMEPWTLEQVKQRTHKSCKDSFPLLFRDKAEEAKELFYYLYRTKYADDRLAPLPDTEALLNTVKRLGIKTGVVSNKEGDTLRKEVQSSHWKNSFVSVLGSNDTANDKPHPSPVIETLNKLELSKGNHIWFVGDTLVDLECANASNCHPILYGDKVAAPGHEELEFDFTHVENHGQLINRIEGIFKE